MINVASADIQDYAALEANNVWQKATRIHNLLP